jgi:hypothetical protein
MKIDGKEKKNSSDESAGKIEADSGLPSIVIILYILTHGRVSYKMYLPVMTNYKMFIETCLHGISSQSDLSTQYMFALIHPHTYIFTLIIINCGVCGLTSGK